MEMVGGDLFKKVVLLEKLQLLDHVVTEVCNRSLVVLRGKFLLVALACSFYQVFVIIKTSSEKEESQKPKLQLFWPEMCFLGQQKINLPTTIITSFDRKNIA